MQVLGSLIQLPPDRDALPLPWWHRAPLGLLDKTAVYLALVGTKRRPVGNLVVSVLNPSDWDRMTIVEGQEEDQPGVIANALDAVLPFNIAVAETVTTEAGDQHHVSLVCEPFGANMPEDPRSHIANKLEQYGFRGLRSREFLGALPPILWHDVVQVEHGWIWDTKWRQQIETTYPETVKQVDLERAIVSADTERRLLRFLFPRKGALSIQIQHADVPGALLHVARVFRDLNLNVLASLLRRGGAKPKNALLLAICEPHVPSEVDELGERVLKGLAGLPHELRAHSRILDAANPEELIYSHHPDEVVARVPASLRPVVMQYKRQLPAKKTPIFVSRRFLRSERRNKIVQTVHAVLAKYDCIPIEAQPEPGEFTTSTTQVSAKMWISRAGIVLVSGAPEDAFSINLAHEAGFLQGQGKAPLVLVEDGAEVSMQGWTNASGLVAPRFPKDDRAFDPLDPNSLEAIISTWIASIRKGEKRQQS